MAREARREKESLQIAIFLSPSVSLCFCRSFHLIEHIERNEVSGYLGLGRFICERGVDQEIK